MIEKEIEKELEEDDHHKNLYKENLISIDQISYKFNNNYYHNLERLLSDYSKLITNTIKRRSKN